MIEPPPELLPPPVVSTEYPADSGIDPYSILVTPIQEDGQEHSPPGYQRPFEDQVELIVSFPADSGIEPLYLVFQKRDGGVTNEQLKHRALTGVAPDGHVKVVKGKTILPPMSSAFHSDELLVYADQFVRNNGPLETAIRRNPGKTFITVKPADVGDLGLDLGRGFERISGSTLRPELQGAPRLVENLSSVQATYEFNQVTKVWETITIFPSR